MSTNLLGAHRQWASRPVDERFWGLDDMSLALHNTEVRSNERKVPVKQVRATSYVDETGKADLVLYGSAKPVTLTHWSMGQLSTYAGAPASYLRSLPPALAAQCLNNGLEKYDGEDVQLLLHRNGEPGSKDYTLRAMTTQYSRLWNTQILNALKPALDRGWMVPPARPCFNFSDPRARPATAEDIVPGQDSFGLSVRVGDMIAPAGCYAGDRDMFIFLVNPTRVIEVNSGDSLMRGVFIWNSEVGAGAFKVKSFYLESVCGNHIVWGAKDVRTFRLVHKGNNFHNIGGKLGNQLAKFGDRDTAEERNMLNAARNYVLGSNREEVVETVGRHTTLSQKVIDATYTVAIEYEHTAKAAPTTAWGMAHALTRYSQATPYADERSKLDTAAGELLQIAYKAKS